LTAITLNKSSRKNLGKDLWCLQLGSTLIPNCSFQTTSKSTLVCGQTAKGITHMFKNLPDYLTEQNKCRRAHWA